MSLSDAISSVDNTLAGNGGNSGEFSNNFYANPRRALELLSDGAFLLTDLHATEFPGYYKMCKAELVRRVNNRTFQERQGFDSAGQVPGTFDFEKPGGTPVPPSGDLHVVGGIQFANSPDVNGLVRAIDDGTVDATTGITVDDDGNITVPGSGSVQGNLNVVGTVSTGALNASGLVDLGDSLIVDGG